MNETNSYPDDNPKTVIGVTKVPLWLVPPSAKHFLAEAFADGAKKYGPYNWREKTVSASVYVSAAQRHLDEWLDGEDRSRDATVEHLGHVMACCAIVLDAMTVGKLNDDRPPKGAATDLHEKFANKKKELTDGGSQAGPTCECSFIHGPDGNTVELCGVSDIQADVFPEVVGSGRYYGFDGEYEYWYTPDRGMVRYRIPSNRGVSDTAVSELFRGRGEAFNPLYDLTQGDSGGAFPLAARNEDG